jgi:uncharacterized DUF497 family protein
LNGLQFEWDRAKAASNLRKHAVSFEEAETVFEDPNAWRQYDTSHSSDEDRWRVIGISMKLRLLSVIYLKADEKTIRLISARRTNQAEALRYTGEA